MGRKKLATIRTHSRSPCRNSKELADTKLELNEGSISHWVPGHVAGKATHTAHRQGPSWTSLKPLHRVLKKLK